MDVRSLKLGSQSPRLALKMRFFWQSHPDCNGASSSLRHIGNEWRVHAEAAGYCAPARPRFRVASGQTLLDSSVPAAYVSNDDLKVGSSKRARLSKNVKENVR